MKQRPSYSPIGSAEQSGTYKNHLEKYVGSDEVASFKLSQRRLINREALDVFLMKLEKLCAAEVRGDV